MPPHVLPGKGQDIMYNHLGLCHFIKSNGTVGSADTGGLEAAPGGFGQALTHKVIVNGDHASHDSAAQFFGVPAVFGPD